MCTNKVDLVRFVCGSVCIECVLYDINLGLSYPHLFLANKAYPYIVE